MSRAAYRGIPRDEIPWYPMIQYKDCVACGKCMEYCTLGVYGSVYDQGEKKVVVNKPYNCVVLCTGCEDQCPVGAVTFPSKEEIQKLMERKVRDNQPVG